MLFSIIYSVDVPEDLDIDNYAPPQADELWDMTEDGRTEYAYLDGDWTNGTHQKWCAILDRDQFDKFVRTCGLSADSTETMGSIGALGSGYWAPAINFDAGHSDCIANAYVTPLPEVRRQDLTEADWHRLRDAMLAVYS
jgi:hypothetical protein